MSSQAKSSLLDVLLRTWYLGVTSFGGPVVHFQIFHRKFVEGQDPWLDEQTVRYLPSASSVPGLMIFSFTVSGAFCDLSGPSRSSQHEVRILHSTRKGRIFGSCHVFPDLEVSSLSSRQSIYHWAFFSLSCFICGQTGIMLPFIQFLTALERLISTNSFCVKFPWSSWDVRFGHRNFSRIQCPSTTRVRSPFWSKCGNSWRHSFRGCTASDKSHH